MLFRIDSSGLENLPAGGGWIAAGAPHRNWVEPFLLLGLLPQRPVWLADRRTVLRSHWRRWAARLAGGTIPVGARGGQAFEQVATGVARAVEAGRVVVVFPEVGPPSRPPELRRLSPGVAHFAVRTDSPVTPIVFGGTHDLYLRRRIIVRVLAPLRGLPPNDCASIDAWMTGFEALIRITAHEAHASAESSRPKRRRWRWLSGRYPRSD